jgi:hypothetical protein
VLFRSASAATVPGVNVLQVGTGMPTTQATSTYSPIISGTQTNICSVNFQNDESETVTMTFMLEVHDREHLARVIRTVRRMNDVVRIVRTIAGQNRRRDS